MGSYQGRCHCGDITLAFDTHRPIAELGSQTCSCAYCRRRGAAYTSDPDGKVRVRVRQGGDLVRYRFGTEHADFISCARCGNYLGAFAETGEGGRMVVSLANFELKNGPPSTSSMDYDGETAGIRLDRWLARWTPAKINSEDAGFGA